MLRFRPALIGALAAATMLTACATPTPYRPAVGNGFNRTGFSDQQIERDRFRVSFAGNSYTSRETVERYLLFRAAQLTVETGGDHFILADRDTDKQTRTYATPGIGGFGGGFGRGFGYGGIGGGWGGWAPGWRYHGRGFGWRAWDPFFGDPFWGNNIDIRTVDRYEAIAEIVTGRGPKPRDNVRAFDARDVIERIGPTVRFPEEPR